MDMLRTSKMKTLEPLAKEVSPEALQRNINFPEAVFCF